MKLLRYGSPGAEKPGLFASDGSIRDLSGLILDIDGYALSAESLQMIASTDAMKLPKVDGNPRIGPCIARPVNYVCIGLNYADHAAEAGMPVPKEPTACKFKGQALAPISIVQTVIPKAMPQR